MSRGGLRCTGCGRPLNRDEHLARWGECNFCGSPVCFACARYMPVRRSGLYGEYRDIVRVCSKCAVEKAA